jgi:hypothetical protein
VVLVEGESDTQTLWFHGFPALGTPGVDTWKEAWAEHLEGIERIYAVIEPDKGGATLKDRLSTSGIRDRLHLVNLGECKDPSELRSDYVIPAPFDYVLGCLDVDPRALQAEGEHLADGLLVLDQ